MLELCSTNEIFQDLVHGMSYMEASIGVWRPIMQHKWLLLSANLRLPGIQVIGASLEVFGLVGRSGSRAGDVLSILGACGLKI
jgi:hypothetical protein